MRITRRFGALLLLVGYTTAIAAPCVGSIVHTHAAGELSAGTIPASAWCLGGPPEPPRAIAACPCGCDENHAPSQAPGVERAVLPGETEPVTRPEERIQTPPALSVARRGSRPALPPPRSLFA